MKSIIGKLASMLLLLSVAVPLLAAPLYAQGHAQNAPLIYTVQPGDTLFSVSLRHRLSVQQLITLNQLSTPIIYVGQKLIAGEAPPLPTPIVLPDSAQIATAQGAAISGRMQAMPLDCETRSAVDWAGFFGVAIDELTFLSQLPLSDNPETGFVGNVYGVWGQIPPNDYGVHAEPIAAVLRAYHLPAAAHRGTNWDTVRAEIAANRPVIVWVTGHAENYGAGQLYTASDGTTTLVAA
ncbi:MAG TPA: LysM peptidoglycan-binding domain-containing protein [Anaerolineae bacterium]|nr:LysM peptidoglycan-binding domain-containing protein [Anaerolineae bacterium]